MSHQRHTGPSGLMVIFAAVGPLESLCLPSQDLQMLRGRPSVFFSPAAALLGRVECVKPCSLPLLICAVSPGDMVHDGKRQCFLRT